MVRKWDQMESLRCAFAGRHGLWDRPEGKSSLCFAGNVEKFFFPTLINLKRI